MVRFLKYKSPPQKKKRFHPRRPPEAWHPHRPAQPHGRHAEPGHAHLRLSGHEQAHLQRVQTQPRLDHAARLPAGLLQTARQIRGQLRILQHRHLPARTHRDHSPMHIGHESVLRCGHLADSSATHPTPSDDRRVLAGARRPNEGGGHGPGIRSALVRPATHCEGERRTGTGDLPGSGVRHIESQCDFFEYVELTGAVVRLLRAGGSRWLWHRVRKWDRFWKMLEILIFWILRLSTQI